MNNTPFFLKDGSKTTALAPLTGSKLNFGSLLHLPSMKRSNRFVTVEAMVDNFNPRHLNMKETTIAIPSSSRMLEPKFDKESSNKYLIREVAFEVPDGTLLQLLYHNQWYGIVLGDTQAILHKLFSDQALDVKSAFAAISEVSASAPENNEFRKLKSFWEIKAKRLEEEALVNRINTNYRLYLDAPNPMLRMELMNDLNHYLKQFPNGILSKRYTTIRSTLQKQN